MSFSNNEILQYQRQMILKNFGKQGQQKLKDASILCIGAGGLGAPVLMYLAAAGIGKIGIVDNDVVDQTNLHRQIIHSTSSINSLKTSSAKQRMLEINPFIEVVEHKEFINSTNAFDLIKEYDLVVDGTDNFKTRYLINDASVILGKSVIFGSIHEFVGQVTVFGDSEGPCYRCLFPIPPDPESVSSCSTIGVFGVLPGVIGSLQATEAIKYILKMGEPLVGRLQTYDALKMTFDQYKVKKSKKCPVCSENPTITELIDYDEFCGLKQSSVDAKRELTLSEIENKLNSNKSTVLIDIRDDEVIDLNILDLSKRISYHRILSESGTLLNKELETIFLCNSGKQSLKLLEVLEPKGFTKLFHLKDGLEKYFN